VFVAPVRSFAEADRQARELPRLPLVVRQAATDAAVRVGDPPRAEHYRKLRDAERRRTDVEIGRADPWCFAAEPKQPYCDA